MSVGVRASRASLVGLVDDYLSALRKKKPDALGLDEGVRFTENGQVLPLGQGLWTTVTQVADEPHLLVADDVAGSVVAFTWVYEVAAPEVLVTRLRTEDGQVREIETIVSRGTYVPRTLGLSVPAANTGRRSIFDEVVPAEARRSRRQLADATNLYLEGIERTDGSVIPVSDDCRRIENGVQTALNRTGEGMPDADSARGDRLAMGVAEQISRGAVAKIVERARGRRFGAIDEERGAVALFFLFDHPGPVPWNGRSSGSVRFPNSLYAGEVFKHVDGQIVHIEAGFELVPYGMSSGWE